MGVSGDGCLAELRNGGGTATGVNWWKISGRRRWEKSLAVTGAKPRPDGAGEWGERGSEELGLGLARPGARAGDANRAGCAVTGDLMTGEVRGFLASVSPVGAWQRGGRMSGHTHPRRVGPWSMSAGVRLESGTC